MWHLPSTSTMQAAPLAAEVPMSVSPLAYPSPLVSVVSIAFCCSNRSCAFGIRTCLSEERTPFLAGSRSCRDALITLFLEAPTSSRNMILAPGGCDGEILDPWRLGTIGFIKSCALDAPMAGTRPLDQLTLPPPPRYQSPKSLVMATQREVTSTSSSGFGTASDFAYHGVTIALRSRIRASSLMTRKIRERHQRGWFNHSFPKIFHPETLGIHSPC